MTTTLPPVPQFMMDHGISPQDTARSEDRNWLSINKPSSQINLAKLLKTLAMDVFEVVKLLQ